MREELKETYIERKVKTHVLLQKERRKGEREGEMDRFRFYLSTDTVKNIVN